MVISGDILQVLPSLLETRLGTIQTIVTSPPYWGLRDYSGGSREIGREPDIETHLDTLVRVFRGCRDLLRSDGTLWLNYGSRYAKDGGSGVSQGRQASNRQRNIRGMDRAPGFKPKDLMILDSLLAEALRQDGWYLRSEIVWTKPNAAPESSRDRPGRDHEKVWLLAKSKRYYYDRMAVLEPFRSSEQDRTRVRAIGSWAGGDGKHDAIAHSREGRQSGGAKQIDWNRGGRFLRTTWPIPCQPSKLPHFATFPLALAERCILLGSKPGDLVFDPFAGVATTGCAAVKNGRRFLGVEISDHYAMLARERIDSFREKK